MKDALQKRAALCLKACDGLTIKELVNDQLYIGSAKWDYRVMRLAMEWWRARCRYAQALLNDAVKVSRAQAANFTAMKHRAETAESELAAMRQRAERAEEALRPFAALDMSPYADSRDGRTFYQLNETEITVGDIRRARAALSVKPKEQTI